MAPPRSHTRIARATAIAPGGPAARTGIRMPTAGDGRPRPVLARRSPCHRNRRNRGALAWNSTLWPGESGSGGPPCEPATGKPHRRSTHPEVPGPSRDETRVPWEAGVLEGCTTAALRVMRVLSSGRGTGLGALVAAEGHHSTNPAIGRTRGSEGDLGLRCLRHPEAPGGNGETTPRTLPSGSLNIANVYPSTGVRGRRIDPFCFTTRASVWLMSSTMT